ncbi:CPBP family intramembrane glutamic endopeptidase [Elongatibacter sediminis]|uniref:CPBP family intramembrane glutamic endopeptidase n=1 Tax=Elongatibacter sediminis TaxID=3119006 RepID=A0AAW9RIJ6_9GAMM
MIKLHRLTLVFLLLVAALYPLGLWLVFRLQSASPLMLTVGLAAIGACLLCRKDLGSLGWGWKSWRSQWASYLVPLGYATLAYGLIWSLDLGTWYDADQVAALREGYSLESWSDGALITFHFVLTATVSFVLLLPSVLGEEVGWRGVLVPDLARRLGFTWVALISGLIWAAWHWPIMLLGIYGNAEVPLGYQLTFFTITLVSMSVVMTYFRYATGSLWPAVIFHMSHNVFLQKFFSPLTAETANSAWFLDEFGLVLPLVTGGFAVYFWRKGVRAFDPPARTT